jgi:hypothetical protein
MPVSNKPNVVKQKSFGDILTEVVKGITYEGDPEAAAKIRKELSEAVKNEALAGKAGAETGQINQKVTARGKVPDAFGNPRDKILSGAAAAEGKVTDIGKTLLGGAGATTKNPNDLMNYQMGAGKDFKATTPGTSYVENNKTALGQLKANVQMRGQNMTRQNALDRLQGTIAAAKIKASGKSATEANKGTDVSTQLNNVEAALTQPGIKEVMGAPKVNSAIASGANFIDAIAGTNLKDSTRADENTTALETLKAQSGKMAYSLAKAAGQGRLTDQDFRVFTSFTGIQVPDKPGPYNASDLKFSSSFTPENMFRAVRVMKQWDQLPEEVKKQEGVMEELFNAYPPEIASQEYRGAVGANMSAQQNAVQKQRTPQRTFKAKDGTVMEVLD